MLRRFADARLRSDLDKARDTREKLRRLARHFAVSLKEARTENARLVIERDEALAALRDVLDELRDARQTASRHATNAAGFRAQLAAERARTQETQP